MTKLTSYLFCLLNCNCVYNEAAQAKSMFYFMRYDLRTLFLSIGTLFFVFIQLKVYQAFNVESVSSLFVYLHRDEVRAIGKVF